MIKSIQQFQSEGVKNLENIFIDYSMDMDDYLKKHKEARKGWQIVKRDETRIYRQNAGDMLELVRYQKNRTAMAAGCEEIIYSSTEMLIQENANRRRLGVLADTPIYSIPYPQIRKIANLKNHIWGL